MNQGLTEILAAHYRQKSRATLPLVVIMFLALLGALFVVSVQQVPELRELKDAPPYEKVGASIRKGDVVKGVPYRCSYPSLDRAGKYEQCVEAEKSRTVMTAGMILALPFFGFVGFLGYFAFMRRPVERSSLYRLFAQEREQIVWVYEIETKVRAAGVGVAGFSSVGLGLRSGKVLRLTPIGVAQADVMSVLADEVSGATFGYSETNRQNFARDPAAMRTT